MTVRQTLEAGSPLDIYKSVLTKKYADFTGRARRAEYWWFALMNIGVLFGIIVVFFILGSMSDTLAVLMGILYVVYGLGVIVPGLGRRGSSSTRHEQEWLGAVDRIHPTGGSDPAPRVLLHRR